MVKHSITIEVTEDTHKNLAEIAHLINNKLKLDKPLVIEDIVKASLYRYISKLYTKSNLEWDKEITKLFPLDSDFPLKNSIKTYLAKVNLTQSDLSKRAKLPISTVSSILNNQNQPSIDAFLKIYFALDCPDLTELLYREQLNEIS